MTKLKKASLALLALLCSTCLVLGAGFFNVFVTAELSASAATYEVLASDLDIRDGVLHGFKEGAVPDKETYKYFNLSVPSNVTAIAENAFNCEGEGATADYSHMLTVTLPAGLVSIGDGAFAGCVNLLEVVTPAGSAFDGALTLGSDANGAIAKYAKNVSSEPSVFTDDTGCRFVYDKANETLDTATGDVTAGAWILFDYEGTATGDFVLPTLLSAHGSYPAGNYSIYNHAFRGAAFTGIMFNSTVVGMGSYAFAENTQLGIGGGTVIIPATVGEIGAYAFYGCTSLTGSGLTIESGVEAVRDFAFAGCSALDSVKIPGSVKSIGQGAFKDCEGLVSVNFLPYTEIVSGDGGATEITLPSKLLTIGNNAFDGCSLKVAEIPAGVTQIGAGAFINNQGLGYVYLPTDAEFINVEDNTPCFDRTTVLICTDSASYDLNYAKPALSAHAAQLTYVIKIKGYAGEGIEPAVTLDKLYKNSYSLTKQVSTADSATNGSWYPAENPALPVQSSDYSKSVWYKSSQAANETSASDKLDIAYLDAELAKKQDEIKIYAPLTWKRPADGISTSWTYDENTAVEFDATTVLGKFSYPTTENFAKISSATYLAANAAAGAQPVEMNLERDKIKDAGAYAITVDLDEEKYGSWTTPAVLTVNVTRKAVDLTAALAWTPTVEGKELALRDTVARYIYIDDSGVPHIASIDSPKDTVYVKQSYVYYQNKQITLSVSANAQYYTAGAVSNASQTAAGVYKSAVTLTATNNYMFATSMSNDASMLGISVEYDDINTRTKATVTKTWYIVQVSNMLTTAAGGDIEFSIADWTFGGTVTLNAPFLKIGETSAISFELYKDGVLVGAFEYGDYADYINAAMPVGDYVLKANVDGVSGSSGAVDAFTENFDFSVNPATINAAAFATSNGRNYEYELAASNTRYLAFDDAIKLVENLMTATGEFRGMVGIGPVAVTPSGYWAEHRSEYYAADASDYTLTFRYGDSSSDIYYKNTDEALWSRIAPRSFNVYFNVEMKNHKPLNQSANYGDKFFTVTVYQKVASPELTGEFVYTSSDVKPDVANTATYAVRWNDGEYVSAGAHSVTFELLNPDYYRWADAAHVDESNAALLTLEYTVKQAENAQTTSLYLMPWAYNETPNAPVWGTRFGTASNYKFTLAGNGNTYVYGDASNGFDKAEAGAYTLKAECKIGANVKDFSVETSFTIDKAENRWDEAPNIRRWSYGEYEQTAENYKHQLITAKPRYGESVILTITRKAGGDVVYEGYLTWSDAGYAYSEYNGKSFDEIFVKAADGEYLLNFEVLGTSNFTGLDSNMEFKIFPLGASSSNAWRKLPSISSWKVDAQANELYEGEAFHDGARTVSYYLASDYEANGENATKIDKPTQVGRYIVVITVDPEEDAYNKLVAPLEFEILAADNNTVFAALGATIFVIAIGITALAAVVVVMLIRRTRRVK